MAYNTEDQSGQSFDYDGAMTNYGYAEPPAGAPADTNQAGADQDPFAYTNGSLLTPWTGKFDSSGYSTGGGAPTFVNAAYTPFSYNDFSYDTGPSVGQFNEVYKTPDDYKFNAFGENYQDPAAYQFADFQGPSDFRAPTAEDMRNDPGYQARMDAVQKAQVAGAAHGGVLRSGGFQKGLAKAVGDQASQEYGNVYQRRAGEHDRLRSEAQSTYGINQGNTKQAFDTNTQNRLQGYQTRQGTWRDNTTLGQNAWQGNVQNQLQGYGARQNAWQANANTALAENQFKYNVATGSYDRNYGKALTGWGQNQQHNEQVADTANRQSAANAAAGAANANTQYQRDLGDYTRSRDEFFTNQDRQYNILDRERTAGQNATNQYANHMMNGYGAEADYAMGAANAQAAGTQGSANAYGNYASDMGNTIGGMAMYGAMYGRQPAPAGPRTGPVSGPAYGNPNNGPRAYGGGQFTGWQNSDPNYIYGGFGG